VHDDTRVLSPKGEQIANVDDPCAGDRDDDTTEVSFTSAYLAGTSRANAILSDGGDSICQLRSRANDAGPERPCNRANNRTSAAEFTPTDRGGTSPAVNAHGDGGDPICQRWNRGNDTDLEWACSYPCNGTSAAKFGPTDRGGTSPAAHAHSDCVDSIHRSRDRPADDTHKRDCDDSRAADSVASR
jgi:hypothetical protein